LIYMARQKRNKIILGVTGGFGTGKSTVSGLLKSFGAKVIDADQIARRLLDPGTREYKRVVALFGREILKKDKRIDRAKLGGIVFSDRRLLKRLNDIIHPSVISRIIKEIKASRRTIVVLDAPLLIEAGLKKIVDKLIVVLANRANQISRIQRSTFLKKPEILKRINAQMPLSAKVSLADFVIDNNGAIRDTRKQVKDILRKMDYPHGLRRFRKLRFH